jgi:hypothetical protein
VGTAAPCCCATPAAGAVSAGQPCTRTNAPVWCSYGQTAWCPLLRPRAARTWTCAPPILDRSRAQLDALVRVGSHIHRPAQAALPCGMAVWIGSRPGRKPYFTPCHMVYILWGRAGLSDSSGFRLLLRLAYAAWRERGQGVWPDGDDDGDCGGGLEAEVIEDDFDAMRSLDDHWASMSDELRCSIEVSWVVKRNAQPTCARAQLTRTLRPLFSGGRDGVRRHAVCLLVGHLRVLSGKRLCAVVAIACGGGGVTSLSNTLWFETYSSTF